MGFDEQLADRAREIIARTESDVVEKRMFGGLCFLVNGKMCVGVEKDRLMIRFDPARNDEIMEMPGVAPMDFTKRVMKGYAFIELEALTTVKQIEHWIDVALEFNKHAKPSKKKKKSLSQYHLRWRWLERAVIFGMKSRKQEDVWEGISSPRSGRKENSRR